MGNERSEMTFLRPPYYRDSEQNCRVFEASLVWGITEGRTAGKQSERDRVRERERERYYADSEMDFRVFAASLVWGFGRGFSDVSGQPAMGKYGSG